MRIIREYRAFLFSIAVALLLAVSPRTDAQSIVGATRLGGSGNTPPEVVIEGLEDCVEAFVDRTHSYVNMPADLVGIDYVKVANNDKTVADYELEVEVDGEGELLLFIDFRVGDDSNADEPTVGQGVMDWVVDMGFEPTGDVFDIDENPADDLCLDVNQMFAVYSLPVEEGVTVLGEQNDGGGRNMYGVAFTSGGGAGRPCPLALRANIAEQNIELAWTPGDRPTNGVDVMRGDELIADGAPVDPPEYVDQDVPPGVHSYELVFDVPGQDCAPLTVEVNTCITGLSATVDVDGVQLAWSNPRTYAGIRVLRDGEELDVVAGDATTFTDTDPPLGEHTYEVVPENGSCDAAAASVAIREPQGIVSVLRGGSSGAPDPMIVPAGLQEGVPAYVDRTHAYVNIPEELLGIDYVMVANDDKTVFDYTLELEVERDGILYLFIDHRVGTDDRASPPDLSFVMNWVEQDEFEDTELTLEIDENNDGSVDNTFHVYALEAPADLYTLFEQNDGGSRNMYGVAFKATEEAPIGSMFVRGDSDASGSININDAVFTLNYLFVADSRVPTCLAAADVDDNSSVNINDGIYVLNFLFNSGPDPLPPHPDCGVDPTDPGAVTCEEPHPACQ